MSPHFQHTLSSPVRLRGLSEHQSLGPCCALSSRPRSAALPPPTWEELLGRQ